MSAKRKPPVEPQDESAGGKRPAHPQEVVKKIYNSYWTEENVNNGIASSKLVVGSLRIDKNNNENAYVSMPDGSGDIYIGGMKDRNRGLNLDEVVVEIYSFEKWRVFLGDFEDYMRTVAEQRSLPDDAGQDVILEAKNEGTQVPLTPLVGIELSEDLPNAAGTLPIKSTQQSDKEDQSRPHKGSSKETPTKKITSVYEMRKNRGPLAQSLFGSNFNSNKAADSELVRRFTQRTGRVVYIAEERHPRVACGHLKLMIKNKNMALLTPNDRSVPCLRIPLSECPSDFGQHYENYAITLFVAQLKQWDEISSMPIGTLLSSLGEAGEIDAETNAVLISLGIDYSPFSATVTECLPSSTWTIPETEYTNRKDLRSSCIFTIDSATAECLDDAISVEELGGGMYSVGVHIADVSFFVTEDTELDRVASRRATSVYLTQKAIPMLPPLLNEVCSLSPHKDKLTVSVIWTVKEKGEISDEWFGQSVIRSCVKLSFDQAQDFIEGRTWNASELPSISNSFAIRDIVKKVEILHKITANIREERFKKGAIQLDQVKLKFHLNKNTGSPNGYAIYEQKDSERLIEELMILANRSVSSKIKTRFPDKAILKCQAPPEVKRLQALEELCKKFGIKIKSSTAGELHKFLIQYSEESDISHSRSKVLVLLLSQCMQRAKYLCVGAFPEENLHFHYSLNIPHYTDFTSPIRRYIDIIVHRLLGAAVGYSKPPESPIQVLQKLVDHCNSKKQSEQMALKQSTDLFFSLFLKEYGPLNEKAMVKAVLNTSFDVLILKLGMVKRIFLAQLPLSSHQYHRKLNCPELQIEWQADDSCDHITKHKITLFTVLDCCLTNDKEPVKWICNIVRPKEDPVQD